MGTKRERGGMNGKGKEAAVQEKKSTHHSNNNNRKGIMNSDHGAEGEGKPPFPFPNLNMHWRMGARVVALLLSQAPFQLPESKAKMALERVAFQDSGYNEIKIPPPALF